MKFSFFLFLLPLIIASSSFNYEAFFGQIKKLKNLDAIIDQFEKAIDGLSNIFNDKERKDTAQKIADLISYFKENYKEFKVFVTKLKDLQKNLSKYGVSETTLLNGITSFFSNILNIKMNDVGKNLFYMQNYYLLHNKNTNLFNQFSSMEQMSKTVQNANLFKEYFSNGMNQISSLTNKLYLLKAFKIGGNLLSGSFRAYEKIKKCKNKDSKAYLVSTAQAATNVGTNFAFGSIGSFLGSFIPIPIVGTFVGGIAGNYIGDFVNSFYDFDC